MFEVYQSNKREDLNTMLARLKVVDDIISYNNTFNLGEKYDNWIYRHRDLIEELEYMIKEDLVRYEVGN